MTIKLITAFVIAFITSAGVGYFLVPFLRRVKAGQSIREDGPVWHMSKSGTPTMGGIMFIAAVSVACITIGFAEMLRGSYVHIFVLAFAMIFFAIYKKYVTGAGTLWSLFAILGGGVGNLIDRVRLGYVVDMIETEFISFPVFNVADCFITCGAIALCLFVFLEDRKEKALKTAEAEKDGEAEA